MKVKYFRLTGAAVHHAANGETPQRLVLLFYNEATGSLGSHTHSTRSTHIFCKAA
jgi:hypothetical protein